MNLDLQLRHAITRERGPTRRALLSAGAVGGLIAAGMVGSTSTISAANAACSADSLVSAVAAANGGTDGGVVNLAAGCTYTMTAVNNTADGANAFPDITGTVTINGNGATITRSNSAPAFRFLIADNTGNLTLNNLTLSNGQAEAQPHGGGAVLNRGHLSVTGVSFLNNSAPYDATSAVGGGAIDNHDSGNATVTRSTFTGNSAIEGGAIEDEATTAGHGLTVTQSTFINNSTSNFGGPNGPYGGGGVENQLGGNDTLIGNTFVGNSAIEGGGIANAGTMTVTNNTLYNNHAGTNGGGGIQNYGNITITQTTLSGNSSAGGGADLHTYAPPTPAAAPVTTISQSIVANGMNSANCSGTGVITDSGYNLDDGTSCGFTAANNSITSTDPQLGPMQSNGGPTQTMAPFFKSPVVDAIPSATAGCAGGDDQRGISRPQGNGCDIGSMETVFATLGSGSVDHFAMVDGGSNGSAVLAVEGSGTFARPSTGSSFGSQQLWSNTPFYGSVATTFANVTGSGQPASAVAINSSSIWVMSNQGNAFGVPQLWSSATFYGSRGTFMADLDGSGRASAVAINGNSVWVMPNTGSSFGSPRPWSSQVFYGSRGTFLADVDGSGRASVVAINDGSIWVMLNTGSSFSAPQQWSNQLFYGSRGTFLADVNGSGHASAVAINDSSIWVMLNNGHGFSAPQLWANGAFYGSLGTYVADVDGSGRASAIAVNANSVWVCSNTGGAFGAPAQWLATGFSGTH